MSEPRYPYVCVLVPEADAELCSLELWEQGATGIEQRDAHTLTAPEPVPDADVGEPRVMLLAGFSDQAAAAAAVDALTPRFDARVAFLEGDGWKHAWKAYFKPTRVGERLVVRPSWEPYEPRERDLVITIDPGTAFGTGTHETTQLVMRELERRLVPGARVLDVGCGSGILSIACVLLGAEHVDALDVDPDAVRIARENVELNHAEQRVALDTVPVEQVTARYPLVLANIETRILVPLAAALMQRVAPGGTLVLSGVLVVERERALAAYTAFELVDTAAQGEWIALTLRSPAAPDGLGGDGLGGDGAGGD